MTVVVYGTCSAFDLTQRIYESFEEENMFLPEDINSFYRLCLNMIQKMKFFDSNTMEYDPSYDIMVDMSDL